MEEIIERIIHLSDEQLQQLISLLQCQEAETSGQVEHHSLLEHDL